VRQDEVSEEGGTEWLVCPSPEAMVVLLCRPGQRNSMQLLMLGPTLIFSTGDSYQCQ
jgi:hypothetical protein